MHDQRLSTAGGAHERQLIQLICRIWLEIDEAKGLTLDLPQPCVQVIAEGVRVGKVPIQIHLREKQRDILKILPLQAAALFSDQPGMTADVLIIQAQLFRRDGSASHLADAGDVGIKVCVAAFVDALIFAAVQLFAERAEGIQLQLMQEIAEQHKLVVERGPLICLSFRHNNTSPI